MYYTRMRVAFVACLSIACLAANESVSASTFRVSPVRLDVGAFAKSGILTVQNDSSDNTVVIQAKTVQWTQRDGQDVTQPTDELIVNPPIFTLKPGAQQVVRVGARDPKLTQNVSSERAYRLVLVEIPRTPSEDFRGINVALNISIPIFFAGTATTIDGVPPQINASRSGDGKITFDLINRGSTSLKILKVALLDRVTQQPVAEINEWRYALANSFSALAFKPLPTIDYTLSILTDRGVYALDINNATPATRPPLSSAISDAKTREKN